ncbi:hypothetical protein TNCV_4132421, partial [Trichonephila clavipes]
VGLLDQRAAVCENKDRDESCDGLPYHVRMKTKAR